MALRDGKRKTIVMIGAAGMSVMAALLWTLVSSSAERERLQTLSAQTREEASRRDRQRDETMARLREMREGRAAPPRKFASLEAMVARLNDDELTRLLEGLEAGVAESVEMWLFCALWSEKGRRAGSLEQGPFAPGSSPIGDIEKEGVTDELERRVWNHEQRWLQWVCFLRGYSARYPQAAFESYRAGRGSMSGAGVGEWAVSSIFGNWAERDPEAAYACILSLGHYAGYGTAPTEGFYRHVDPALIPRFKERINPSEWEPIPELVHGMVAGYWAVSDPDAAWAWFGPQQARFTEPGYYVMENFLTTWVSVDPKGLLRWCMGGGKARMEQLGMKPFDHLFDRSPLLAAALVEAGSPAEGLLEGMEMSVGLKRESYETRLQAAGGERIICENAPWSDHWPLFQDWVREFEEAAPRLGIPEGERREWVEKLKGER